MNYNIMNKATLKTACAAVFAAMLCAGCYDLGIEPSVKTPTVETFVDVRDGKEYKKVKIGTQTWMAENLNYAADGSVCYDALWTCAFCPPALMCDKYGRLYDWYTAMGDEPSSSAIPSGVEGICPVGWHLPSDAEWKTLTDYVGAHSGTKLKSHDFHSLEDTHTPEGTDIYNFSALPAGMAIHNAHEGTNDFLHHGELSYWWSTTEFGNDAHLAWTREMKRDHGEEVGKYSMEKHYMLSVRCVHD